MECDLEMKTVGILSLQGCVEPHAVHLRQLGVNVRYVRQARDLEGIGGLILPGGESTTMLKLARQFELWDKLQALSAAIPFWGVCAGSILMAREVENPSQESLGIMDIQVRRNAYGRQIDSFQQDIELGGGRMEQAVFIRAPKFVSWGAGVQVSGRVAGEAVFLEEGRHMVTAFHPELSPSLWFHEHFLAQVK
jgi:pyridoxal 5'-phosphate synthase pdxT subunit